MPEQKRVMISSTARDLPDHRGQVEDACLRQGFFPVMMEHLPAADQAISASLRMVDSAEIYVGIIAYRYGTVPAGYDISITEMEYNRAVERRDLPDHRGQVEDACLRQGFFPVMMEHLPAADQAISASLRMVDSAEIYVGIILS